MRYHLLAALAALMLGACANRGPTTVDLMPAPDAYRVGMDPFPATNPAWSNESLEMLYATDREPLEPGSGHPFYGSERGHVLRLGAADVKLGDGGLTWAEIRQISLLKHRRGQYPLQVESAREFGVLDSSVSFLHQTQPDQADPRGPARTFAEAVEEQLARSRKNEITVYVHGYRVTFENPLLVAAELRHYLGYEGAFVAYAWPATPRLFAYVADVETAAYASRQLRILLTFLAQETEAQRINVIGYSAGTRVVMGALAQIALMNTQREKAEIERIVRIGHVVLVSSDIDRDILGGQVIDGVLKVPERLSLYLSSTDRALDFSRWLFGRDRVGQSLNEQSIGPAAVQFLRDDAVISLIDVSGAERASSGGGHDYFRSSPWVSSDILMSLAYDLRPGERALVRDDDSAIWRFPQTYVDDLRERVEELQSR